MDRRYLGEKCKNHPILDADGRCATCWGYFCDACLDDIGDHRYCESCAPAAQQKHVAAQQEEIETRKRLDLRLLMYTLILMLGVVIGGSVIYLNGGLDQFFGSYMPSYQVTNQPKTLGTKLDSFESIETKHFNIYYHSADSADIVNRNVENYFNQILADLLIYEKDVMLRGKFNIIIVKDMTEFTDIFPDVPGNRVAMTDYETKSIVVIESGDTGSVETNLPHEITHAIFFERMNSGNHIPDWIHEGLASYEEAKFNPVQTDARWASFGPEIVSGGGLPLKGMVLAADAGSEEVNFFYSQSQSIVSYLINNYGMLKFMKLSTKLQSGADIDATIKTTYSPDLINLTDLDLKWRASIS
jgi:hypothetical protein